MSEERLEELRKESLIEFNWRGIALAGELIEEIRRCWEEIVELKAAVEALEIELEDIDW